jgi:hypothetical protein
MLWQEEMLSYSQLPGRGLLDRGYSVFPVIVADDLLSATILHIDIVDIRFYLKFESSIEHFIGIILVVFAKSLLTCSKTYQSSVGAFHYFHS